MITILVTLGTKLVIVIYTNFWKLVGYFSIFTYQCAQLFVFIFPKKKVMFKVENTLFLCPCLLSVTVNFVHDKNLNKTSILKQHRHFLQVAGIYLVDIPTSTITVIITVNN